MLSTSRIRMKIVITQRNAQRYKMFLTFWTIIIFQFLHYITKSSEGNNISRYMFVKKHSPHNTMISTEFMRRSATFESFIVVFVSWCWYKNKVDRAAHVLLVFGFVCVECLRHFPSVIIWYYKIISVTHSYGPVILICIRRVTIVIIRRKSFNILLFNISLFRFPRKYLLFLFWNY